MGGGSASADGPKPAGVRFVIVGARRTGSNWLCTLIDSHPAILCHHELFNPAGIFYAQRLRDSGLGLGSVSERDADPMSFLDRVWRHSGGHSCLGFKMTYGQAGPVLDHLLADPAVRKIVLRRRNRVKTCVSEKVAEQLDSWEVYDEADLPVQKPQVDLDPRELREHAARNERFYEHVEASIEGAGQTYLRVDYEDLRSPEEQGRLLRYLDAVPDDAPLQPTSVKQNPVDLREVVRNFDALAEALRGDALRDELLDREA
jgi:LPS sulfotransferase NodH